MINRKLLTANGSPSIVPVRVPLLFRMAHETSHELLTNGAEFQSRWLFSSQPSDRVDSSKWHAVAAKVRSELKDTLEAEGSDGTMGDDNERTGAKKKSTKASKKKEESKGKEKAETKGRAKKRGKGTVARTKARVVVSDADDDDDDDELESEMDEQEDTGSDGATTLTSKAEKRRTSFRNTRYKGNFRVAPAKEDGLPYFDDGWDGVIAHDNDEGSDFIND
jgi:hypothetical protein